MANRKRNSHLHLSIIWLLLGSMLTVRAVASDTVIYSFQNTTTSGAFPYGVLVADSAGNLYGTTYSGGLFGAGTIFELVAAGNYSETILYSFTGDSDGGFPLAGLILDSSGNLYGTASCGGYTTCSNGSGGAGLVFELSLSGTYSVLYPFTGENDGGNPVASLTFDGAKNLYGTTLQGGDLTCADGLGCGVAFELPASNEYHSETVLHRFSGGGDGANPKAPVIFNASFTTLYGTTYQGGSGTCSGPVTGCGVVFQMSIAGVEKVLHHFSGAKDGSLPVAPVIFDQTGTVLYGTASAGGNTTCSGGCGVVFRLSGTSLTTLLPIHLFNGTKGSDPTGGLALDPVAPYYLVGTTFSGGSANLGVIFQLEQTATNTYTYALIHSFTGAPGDGANPFAGPLLGIAPPNGDFIPPGKVGCPSRGCVSPTVVGGAFNFGSVVSD
jgi:uncharacterized repeat protein (TIGR03803 family)